jgi:triacylglycerol lipase
MFAKEWLLAAALLLSLQTLASAAGAPSPMPPEIEQRLREIGRVSAPNETRPLYAPLHGKEPFAGVKITRDLAYGPAERNRLDIFAPDNAAAGGRHPVLLFVHGGAYTGGNKHVAESPFYSNVGVWAAQNGLIGINMTYRLAPQHPWPAAQEDIAAAVRWVSENITAHGGDPARVFLMGHSAGASHASNYVAQTQFHGPKGAGLAGAIFVSAFYDLQKIEATESFKKYHGDDPSLYAQRSPLPGLLRTKLPMLFAVAEFDTPDFSQQANLLNEAFCRSERCPNLIVLPKHSHMSEIYSINTADRGLTNEILSFVRAAPVRASGP